MRLTTAGSAALALTLAVMFVGGVGLQQSATAVEAAAAVDPRAIAERIAVLLQTEYMDAETGKAYAARLREQAAHGAYDGLVGAALAERLTLDLLAVKDDRHLRVRLGAPMMHRMSGPAPTGGPRQPPGDAAPPTIETAGWITPAIAFIRFNEFPRDPAGIEAVRAFLREHAAATTLIFDLRTNHGGGPDLLDALFPILFPKPMRLASAEARRGMESVALTGPNLRAVEGAPSNVKEYWVTPEAAGPLQRVKVLVLTSPATASAAEVFSAAMKWSGRGTLIGGQTAGANHFGTLEMLDGGLTLFLPVGRMFNPADGKDWEGVGIAPDIAVAPEQALTVALVRAGVPEAEAARLSNQYRPTLPMTRRAAPGTTGSASP